MEALYCVGGREDERIVGGEGGEGGGEGGEGGGGDDFDGGDEGGGGAEGLELGGEIGGLVAGAGGGGAFVWQGWHPLGIVCLTLGQPGEGNWKSGCRVGLLRGRAGALTLS